VTYDSYTDPQSEALLRTAQERFSADQRVRHRTLITEGVAAAAFLVAAAAVAVFAPGGRSLSPWSLTVVVVAFVAARRTHFPVGSASTWPAQLIFIPMLFLLPLHLVPLIAAAIMVLDLAPKLLSPRRSAQQKAALFATCIGDSWYTLGPVVVLLAFSAQRFEWSDWPIYLLGFASQVALDLGSGLARTWFAERIVPSAQVQMAWLYITDFCLSCAGLQLAAVAEHRPGLLLLELPVIALLGMFARERSQRMEGTLALSSAYRGTALLLGDVIEDDDEYTGVHSKAVVDLSVAIADRLGLGPEARQRVEFGALLHDVGKIRVPKQILHKPGALTDAEWAIMRQHTVYGEDMLSQVGGTLGGVGRVIRHSHERWDGGGYPDGLAGAQIPVESRIITACDAFNAMTTNRPYRPAMSTADAVAEMQRCAGSHFDAEVVDALLLEVGIQLNLEGRVRASAALNAKLKHQHV
jgi:HD-GYP domain-containing protein (c-di-GMP phosphodiesterase class II)